MTTIGRPAAACRAPYREQAHDHCLPGATNDELAEFFGVSPHTIDRWRANIPKLAEAARPCKPPA